MTDFVPIDNATFECEVVQAQCNRIGYPFGYSMVHIRLIPSVYNIVFISTCTLLFQRITKGSGISRLFFWKKLALCLKNDFRQPQPKPKKKPSEKKFDTYVILTDSVSAGQAKRSQFHRVLGKIELFRLFRKTLQLLEREFEAVWFPYLNKVGKNSRPNAWAIQYGKFYRLFSNTVIF